MSAFVILAVLVVLVSILVVAFQNRGSSKFTTVPGLDPSHPTDGNLGDISKAGSLHEFLINLHQRFGAIASFWMGKDPFISIASPSLFKTQAKVFDQPRSLYAQFEPLITPKSVMYANGDDGKTRRNCYDGCYSHQAMANYYTIFYEVGEEMAETWGALPDGEHLALGHHMLSLAMKAITKTSFGELFEDSREVDKLNLYFGQCWHEMEERILSGMVPDADKHKKFERAKAEIYALLKKAVDVRRKESAEGRDLMLIDTILESGVSDKVVEADCVSYFVGGFHTSGNMMTWALYYLATHSNVQEKLYQEIKQTLGQGEVTPYNINDMVYMRQVLDETMRCSVLAPYAGRYQDSEIELAGHKIPAKIPIIQALGVVLQSDQYWTHPDRFDPDRFSPENKKNIAPYVFEPFGFAGKRKCPGYRFAYTEATIMLSTILRRFWVDVVPGQKVERLYGLVTSPKEEIWITIQKRND